MNSNGSLQANSASPSLVEGSSNNFNPKLPEIELPEFSDYFDTETQFHDTFRVLIHENKALNYIQKYYCLKRCLKDEAAQLISILAMSDTNYRIVVKLLTDR